MAGPGPAPLSSAFGNGGQNINSPVPGNPAGQAPSPAPIPGTAGAAGAGQSAGAPPSDNVYNPFEDTATANDTRKIQQKKEGSYNPFEEEQPTSAARGYKALGPKLRENPGGVVEVLDGDHWRPMGGRELAEYSTAINSVDNLKRLGMISVEDGARIVGAIGGGILGEAAMPAGGGIVGAGAGQAVMGAIANKVMGKQNTMGSVATDAIGGAASAALPMGVGNFLEGQSAQYAAKEAMAPVVNEGLGAIAGRVESRVNAANATGTPIPASQAAPETFGKNPQQIQAEAIRAANQQKLQNQFDSITERYKAAYENPEASGDDVTQAAGQAPKSFSQVFGDILRGHEASIAADKQTAFQVANGKVFPVDSVLSAMRDKITEKAGDNIFKPSGEVDATAVKDLIAKQGAMDGTAQDLLKNYIRMRNESILGMKRPAVEMGQYQSTQPATPTPADFENYRQQIGLSRPPLDEGSSTADVSSPGAPASSAPVQGSIEYEKRLFGLEPNETPGLSLERQDYYRALLQREANFQGMNRDATERAYGEISHAATSNLDDHLIKTLNDSSDNQLAAQRLMANKDFYSTFKEDIQDFQKKVEYDPTNAAAALINGKNPAQVQTLMSILDDKQQKYLAGSYLDNLSKPLIDPVSGRMRVQTVETAWSKVDPKIKETLFGDDTPMIDALIQRARAMETRGLKVQAGDGFTPDAGAAAVDLINKIDKPGMVGFVLNLFRKSPKMQDYIVKNASDVTAPPGMDPDSLARRTAQFSSAAKVVRSLGPMGLAVSGAEAGRQVTNSNQPREAYNPFQ